MLKKILNTNKTKYLIGFLYTFVFYKGYILFLNGFFDYLGCKIIDGRLENVFLLIVTFILSLLPLVFYRGVRKISSFLCIFIYFLLYVPTIVSYYFAMEGENLYVIYQQSLFTIGMCLLFTADKISTNSILTIKSNVDPFKVVFFFTIILTLFIAIVYRNNLKFVALENIYQQRSMNEVYNTNAFISYSLAFLANVFIPITLGYGLFSKKKNYYAVGIFASVILYMATASKYVILLPIIIYLIYFFLKNAKLIYAFNYIGLGLIIIMGFSLLFEFNIYSSILWYRTIGMAGTLNHYYYVFFNENPLTYYSHVNFINAIVQIYPYEASIGEIVGKAYFGESNANANFWAVDGYAGLGDMGIILSSFFLFLFFILINKILSPYNLLFLILIFLSYTISITNSSLFQSLLSGGGLIIVFFMMFSNNKNNNFITK